MKKFFNSRGFVENTLLFLIFGLTALSIPAIAKTLPTEITQNFNNDSISRITEGQDVLTPIKLDLNLTVVQNGTPYNEVQFEILAGEQQMTIAPRIPFDSSNKYRLTIPFNISRSWDFYPFGFRAFVRLPNEVVGSNVLCAIDLATFPEGDTRTCNFTITLPASCGRSTCASSQTCVRSHPTSPDSVCISRNSKAEGVFCGTSSGASNNDVCESTYCDPNSLKCAAKPAAILTNPPAVGVTNPPAAVPLPNPPTNTKASAYCENGKIYADITFSPSNNASSHKVSYSFANTPPSARYNPVSNAYTVDNISKNTKLNYTSFACNSAGNCIEDQNGFFSLNVGDPCTISNITPAITGAQSPVITTAVTPGSGASKKTGDSPLNPPVESTQCIGADGKVDTAKYLEPRCGGQKFDGTKATPSNTVYCGKPYTDVYTCGGKEFSNAANVDACSKAPWCPSASSGVTTAPTSATGGNTSCASLGGTCMNNVLYNSGSCTPSTGGTGKLSIKQGTTGCTSPNPFCFVCERTAVTPVPNVTNPQATTTPAQQSCYPNNPATNHCYNGNKDCCYPATRGSFTGQYFRCTSAIGTGTSYCTNAAPPASAQSVSSASECSINSDCKKLNKKVCVLNHQNVGTCE